MSNKEAVIEALRDLPEEASSEAIIKHLTTLAAIRRGEEDADAGQLIPHDEVQKRMNGEPPVKRRLTAAQRTAKMLYPDRLSR